MTNVLRIGIASYEEVKERTMKIARGELVPGPRDPKVFFPSMESVGKVLSGKNRELLRCIYEERPASLSDLSIRVKRAQSNLSRTLKVMAKYGLVELRRGARGSVQPVVKYKSVDIHVGLTFSGSGRSFVAKKEAKPLPRKGVRPPVKPAAFPKRSRLALAESAAGTAAE